MFGKNYACLLAMFVVLAPISSAGQGQPSTRLSFTSPSASEAVELRSPVIQRNSILASPSFHADHTGPIGFPEMVRAAGLIFSGTVTGIERQPAIPGRSVETVKITFRVDNAVRGVMPGDTLAISQWIGLWSSGQRYRLGEHILLFLYPRSKLGLTSSIARSLGRFPIDSWGRILLSPQQLSALQKDPVLGGKSRLHFSDFALAVRRASEGE